MISIVNSRGTLVNKLVTSNDTNFRSFVIFRPISRKCFMLLTLYSESFRSANNFARYLAVLWIAVPMFETIGRNGSLSTPIHSMSW